MKLAKQHSNPCMRRLSDNEFNAARNKLTGTDGEQLCLSMFDLSLGRDPRGGDAIIREFEELNWIDNGQFTELGDLIKDPMREFGFWLGRNGKLPGEDSIEALQRNRFAGKRVLELGSGGGCNLISLNGIPSKLTGLEPVPVYFQLTPVFAEMARVPAPEVVEGFAENTPFADESYDVIICYSSHQYMDVNKALKEMVRVLASGGELILSNNTLFNFIAERVVQLTKDFTLRGLKYDGLTIINTFYYQLFGNHLIKTGSGSTANPIYPSYRYMCNLYKKEGMKLNAEKTRGLPSGETVLVGNKP